MLLQKGWHIAWSMSDICLIACFARTVFFVILDGLDAPACWRLLVFGVLLNKAGVCPQDEWC